MTERASIGALDFEEPAPKPKSMKVKSQVKPKPAAREAGFTQPLAPIDDAELRIQRKPKATHQINVKTTAEYAAQFYSIANDNGWTARETLERAIDALVREHAR